MKKKKLNTAVIELKEDSRHIKAYQAHPEVDLLLNLPKLALKLM